MTYSDEEVSRSLADGFVTAKLDTTRPESEEARERFHPVWTPTLIVLDAKGREMWRTVGFLPPREFLAAMRVAKGMVYLGAGEFGKAHDEFRETADRFSDTFAAPEALYWCAVAAYKRDGNPDGLIRIWKELGQRYPKSAWWLRASAIEG